MAARYITNGFHIRPATKANGSKQEVFKPGDTITPTSFELAQFPNKFRIINDAPPVQEDEVELVYVDLENAKTMAQALIAQPPEGADDKELKKLSKYVGQNPTKQENIDKLTAAIMEIVTGMTKPADEEPKE